MKDNLFELRELKVKAGAQVSISLANDGAAVHNLRVAGTDGQYGSPDDTVSEEELVLAGQSSVVHRVAPDKAATYIFRCDYHPIEMLGTIIVE